MLKNYFNVAVRSLLKNRLYSAINISGLSIGITAFIFILTYVNFERSYEDFVKDKDNIYRVRLDVYQNGELLYKSSENYPGAGAALVNDLSEVTRSAKLYNIGSKNNVVITRQGDDGKAPVAFKHRKFLYAEKDFLPMFSYEMVSGSAENALERPFTMVVSESTAKKYFGSEDAIGKFLRLEDDDLNNELCEITGVFKDSPDNTHLKFDVLISFETLFARGAWTESRYKSGWGRKDFYTYIQLENGTKPESLSSKFETLIQKYKPNNVERNLKDVFILQPIQDIHLTSKLTDEAEVNGSSDAVYYLIVVAFFIILIAWVNYVNLSTARAMDRAREVGLRKVLGSHRINLLVQFLMEAIVVNALAILLALGLIVSGSVYFHELAGTPASLQIWSQPWFWWTIALLLFGGSLLSGIYPAFVMSSYKPISVLHGKLKTSSRGILLRKSLVILQFSASVAMMVGTITVYDQMNYMLDQDLGMDLDNTIVVERPSKMDTSRTVRMNNQQTFKVNLGKDPNIESVGLGGMLPGKKLRFKTVISKPGGSKEEGVPFSISDMDYDFANALQLEIVAGRKFERDFQDHLDTVVLITENGSRALGFSKPDDAIGKRLIIERFGNLRVKVVGVMADFHQENLKESKPQTMFFMSRGTSEYFMIKVKSGDLKSTLANIEEQWHSSFHGNPFNYFFLDEYFESYYEADKRFRNLFALFAVFAMFIGCLGLFGLSSFMAFQRMKEIAIRKVLGSSIQEIVTLLSKEFLLLIGIAILISWPIIYLIMENWLQGYAYRIELHWMNFVVSGITVVFIAFVTIGYHTLKSATENPINALNYE